jgi:hypothetical protein
MPYSSIAMLSILGILVMILIIKLIETYKGEK